MFSIVRIKFHTTSTNIVCKSKFIKHSNEIKKINNKFEWMHMCNTNSVWKCTVDTWSVDKDNELKVI